MCRQKEYEKLFAELEGCLFRANKLDLEFASELVKMTYIEISNRYASECKQDIEQEQTQKSTFAECSDQAFYSAA